MMDKSKINKGEEIITKKISDWTGTKVGFRSCKISPFAMHDWYLVEDRFGTFIDYPFTRKLIRSKCKQCGQIRTGYVPCAEDQIK